MTNKETLDLFDKMMVEEGAIDIKDAKCYICGRRVDACAAFAAVFNSNHRWLRSQIYTYWSCEAHGAVFAEINGELYRKPSDLFEEITFDDWNVKISQKRDERC